MIRSTSRLEKTQMANGPVRGQNIPGGETPPLRPSLYQLVTAGTNTGARSAPRCPFQPAAGQSGGKDGPRSEVGVLLYLRDLLYPIYEIIEVH